MPLLPRSRRGTWLLAAAVWLAACAGWWWLMPFAPHAEWELPIETALLGFGPDDREVLTCRRFAFFEGPIVGRDFLTGRKTSSFLDESDRFEQIVLSPNGHWMVVANRIGNRAEHQLVDIGRREIVANFSTKVKWGSSLASLPLQFTPDSRSLIAGGEDKDTDTLKIWNLDPPHEVADIQNLRMHLFHPPAMSSNGRYLATCGAATAGTPGVVRIWDLADYSECRTVLKVNQYDQYEFVQAISDDAHWVAIGNRMILGDLESVRCFNTATGDEVLPDMFFRGHCEFTADGELFVLTTLSTMAVTNSNDLVYEWWTLGDSPGASVMSESRLTSNVGPRLSPDRTAGIAFARITTNPLSQFWSKLTTQWLSFGRYQDSDSPAVVFDAKTGHEIAQIPDSPNNVHWSPDGRTAAFLRNTSAARSVSVWDIPPRKSLTWFAIGAVILALPIAFFAWLRCRNQMAG
jgi:hypothetical protein